MHFSKRYNFRVRINLFKYFFDNFLAKELKSPINKKGNMVSIFGSKPEVKVEEKQKIPFNDQYIDKDFSRNIFIVKKACAIANKDCKELTKIQGEAIIASCKYFIEKQPKLDFGMLQGGAYTALNLEVNEMIANKADEFFAKKSDKPKKLTTEGLEKNEIEKVINPLDHVNKSQSTNDVIPTSLKLTVHTLGEDLQNNLRILVDHFEKKSKEFSKIKKSGRTHLQDAVSITLGEEFQAYANLLRRNREQLIITIKSLLKVNIGGSAIGTSINVHPKYPGIALKNLRRITGKNLQLADNLIDSTQNTDGFLNYQLSLSNLSSALMKICSDLRLLSSGPKTGFNEIIFEKVIRGSSIMPSKVNPILVEYCQQCAMITRGYSESTRIACENGNLELNVFIPVIAKSLINSSRILNSGLIELTSAVKNVSANKENCEEHYKNSLDKITHLSKENGYEEAEKEVNAENKEVKDEVKTKK